MIWRPILCIIFVCLAGCIDRVDTDNLESASAKYELSEREIGKLKVAARNGDATAAVHLAEHYSFARRDVSSALAWYEVAASLGNVDAMVALHLHLSNRGDLESCERAHFWLEKAIEGAPSESFIESNYLREQLKRSRWDGHNCKAPVSN